jgi:PAS domain S-box-containing protein
MSAKDPGADSGTGGSPLIERLAAGTASAAAGDALFATLVTNLAAALDVPCAIVAEIDGRCARTLALHTPEGIERGAQWDLAGTPAEAIGSAQVVHHEAGVDRRFCAGAAFAGRRAQGYLGVPLHAPGGGIVGLLAVFDARPLARSPQRLAILRIFAARAAAELARLQSERTLGESEERLRDLFDEAPIAYVHEDLQSRFLRANRAALRILGVRRDEVQGMVGMSLVPDTPDAQRRVREAFESIGRGTDTSGVVLELRRKDNGKPIWIQWWSKPDPGGTYTRTMFIDITERVLLEQEQQRLEAQNRYLREEIKSVHNFDQIIGRSPALVEVLDGVGRVAGTDASVLITGETGTGKELIARAIHSSSKRHDKPLIKLNCAALPSGLVESELFGHEKGAFSGAIARRIGRFELAQGGTIFLDEIGEMSLDVQAKLLRVLQEHEFERVGGSTTISVDIRVIAATNRDLQRAVREGKFREDLFYRLCVFPLHLPPLRERLDDVPLLVQFFLKKFGARIGKTIKGVTAELQQRFSTYGWPGNVRELENLLERAMILSNGDVLGVESAPLLAAGGRAPGQAAPKASLEAVEREHILAMLRGAGWVIEGPSGAARVLGLHPNTLRSRMKRLGIARSTDQAASS